MPPKAVPLPPAPPLKKPRRASAARAEGPTPTSATSAAASIALPPPDASGDVEMLSAGNAKQQPAILPIDEEEEELVLLEISEMAETEFRCEDLQIVYQNPADPNSNMYVWMDGGLIHMDVSESIVPHSLLCFATEGFDFASRPDKKYSNVLTRHGTHSVWSRFANNNGGGKGDKNNEGTAAETRFIGMARKVLRARTMRYQPEKDASLGVLLH
eukprot:g2131.t1